MSIPEHASVVISSVNSITYAVLNSRFEAANYVLIFEKKPKLIGAGTIVVVVHLDEKKIAKTAIASGAPIYNTDLSCDELRPYVVPIIPHSIRDVDIPLRDLKTALGITGAVGLTNITTGNQIEYARPFIKCENSEEVIAKYCALIKSFYKVKLRLTHPSVSALEAAEPTFQSVMYDMTELNTRLAARLVADE